MPRIDERVEQSVDGHHRLHAALIVREARADRIAGDHVDHRKGLRPVKSRIVKRDGQGVRGRTEPRCRCHCARSVLRHRGVESATFALKTPRETRCRNARCGIQHDHILIIERRKADGHRAAGILLHRRLKLVVIVNLAVAAVAIEEIEFRKCAVCPKLGVGEERQLPLQRHCLARGPDADTVGLAFALCIICIFIMMLLKR